MNKTRTPGARLILFLLLFFASYLAGRMMQNKQENITAPSPAEKGQSPRFSTNRHLPHAAEGKAPEQSEFDALLIRYSGMPPEQLLKELELFCKNGTHEMSAQKELLYSYLLYKSGQTSPKQALEQAENWQLFDISNLFMILEGCANSNPELAAAYYSEHRDDLPAALTCLSLIAGKMGTAAPDRAMKWLASLSERDRKTALPFILSGMAAAHPEQLSKYIKQLSPEEWENTRLCQNLASDWAASDWENAVTWINSLPGEQKKQARKAALERLSTLSPEKTTAEFQKLDDQEQAFVAPVIARGMASVSIPQALEWLINNTPEKTAALNASEAIGEARDITPDLEEYITQMKNGAVKDTCLQALMARIGNSRLADFVDYERTLALADGITDPQKRESATSDSLNKWYLHEPKKARAWIESSGLPESTKKDRIKELEELKKLIDYI